MLRVARWLAFIALLDSVLLLILDWLLSGFELRSLGAALVFSVTIVLSVTFLWPVIYWISFRFHPLLFPLVSFSLTAALVLGSSNIVDSIDPNGVTVDGVWTAIFIAIGLTFGNAVIGALFALNDDNAYSRLVLRPLARSYGDTAKSTEPGFVFIEIDGLALPILERAMTAGYMPTLKRWLDRGDYSLASWEPDLSSQTSASQAGILLGDNFGIPAFRWWDKPSGTLMVSSKMDTARILEARLSSGEGLLANGGASRFNIFSGDAPDCVATFSRVRSESGGQRSYLAYFSNPYVLARTLGLYISEVIRELYEAAAQRSRQIEPRIHRGLSYAFVRGGTNVFLQEAGAFMVAADMLRGLPSIYCTFFAYDEVAHHSGIDRSDSFKVLRKLDQMIARLERVASSAPRPYHLIVLSDHGQSQGATFKQRYGYSLRDLVSRLTASKGVNAPETTDESFGGLSAAITDAVRNDTRSAKLARRLLHDKISDGVVELGKEEAQTTGGLAEAEPAAVVLASGNLGLISFPDWPDRMSLEQITEQFPSLISGLAGHPGISFVLVKSEKDGNLVIGADGFHYLDHGFVAGIDPLVPFGTNAAAHVQRSSQFPTAPDILALSMFDAATGEVAAFEELVGSHGGLGGPQTEPFLLFPTALSFDRKRPIIGAAELHRVLKNWIVDANGNETKNRFTPSFASPDTHDRVSFSDNQSTQEVD